MESPSSAIAGDGVSASRDKSIPLKEKSGKLSFLENGWHDYRLLKNGKPRPSAVRDFPESIVPIHSISTTDDAGGASPTTKSERKIEQNHTKDTVGASASEEATKLNANSAKCKEASEALAGPKPEKALIYSSKKSKATLGDHKRPSLSAPDAVKLSNGNEVVTKRVLKTAEERKSTLTAKIKSTTTALDVSKLDRKKNTTMENSENASAKSSKMVDRKTTSTLPDASLQETESKILKKKVVSTEDSPKMSTKSGKLLVKNVSAEEEEEEVEATSGKKEDASLQDDEVEANMEKATTTEMTHKTEDDKLVEGESIAVPSNIQGREQEGFMSQGQTEEAMDVEKHLEEEKAEKVSEQSKKALPAKRKQGVRDLPELKGRKQLEANVPQGQVDAMDVQKQQETEKVEKVIEQSKKVLPIKRKSGIRDLPEPLMQSKNKVTKAGAGEEHLAEALEMEVTPSKSRETAKENSVADCAKLNSNEKKKRPLEEPSSNEKSKKLPKLKPSNEAQTSSKAKEKEQVVTPKPTKKVPSTPSESLKKPTPSSSSKKVRRSAGKSVRPATSIADVSEARKLVLESLRLYDAVRRKFVQDEEKNGKQSRGSRSDLQAASLLKDQNASRVGEKCVGSLPGVFVGDIFLFRTELSFARVHGPIQGGIEYLTTKDSEFNSPVAISIISNVGQDGEDNGNELIYTGQGGRSADNKQIAAQKLERGNLAMDGSRKFKVPVRVIRGIKDVNSPTGKIYVYDGLYSVEETYTEKGSGGFDEFKFRLQRLPEQPELGSDALKLAADLKSQALSSRKSVVIPDISKGKESQAICVENTVDDDKPAEFKYSTKVTYPDEFGALEPSVGCKCNGACTPSSSCSCFSRNGDELPYLNGGYLVRQKDFIFECGSNCSCSSSCRNRTSANGPKFRLDVFMTAKTGWGVRCLEMIPAGSFVCEYVGKVVANEQEARESGDQKYMMFTRWLPETTPRWGDVPSIIPDRSSSTIRPDTDKPELVVDATQVGNVARFINHSCSPNLLVQRVLSEHQDLRYPHFKLFAIDNIPPLRELTFDYGYPPDQDPETEEIECLCGSSDCRGKLHL